jgi:hypothetical protein
VCLSESVARALKENLAGAGKDAEDTDADDITGGEFPVMFISTDFVTEKPPESVTLTVTVFKPTVDRVLVTRGDVADEPSGKDQR